MLRPMFSSSYRAGPERLGLTDHHRAQEIWNLHIMYGLPKAQQDCSSIPVLHTAYE